MVRGYLASHGTLQAETSKILQLCLNSSNGSICSIIQGCLGSIYHVVDSLFCLAGTSVLYVLKIANKL